mgnify:CR=1 FL=1
MTCVSLRNGKLLPVYRTKALAKQAEKAARKKGYRLIAYGCRNCDGWHLALRAYYREDCEHGCRCLKGFPKKVYKTEADANKTASIISKRRGVEMWVYECTKQEGIYHISSQNGATPKKEKKRRRKRKNRK